MSDTQLSQAAEGCNSPFSSEGLNEGGAGITKPVACGGDGTANQTSGHNALRIDSETWRRDSHDLFDYESLDIVKCAYYISRQARVLRDGTTVTVKMISHGIPTHPQNDGTVDYLLNVQANQERYSIYPADRAAPASFLVPKKLWLIVKDLPGENYSLQEGDVIKLGRFKLRVKQLAMFVEGEPPPELKLDEGEAPLMECSPEECLTMQCRICLLEGGSSEDPLICPCQCKGSIKYVHVQCLRYWIQQHLNVSDDRRFFFKYLPCELCKHLFPSTIRMPSGEKISIVQIPNTLAPFIVLENLVGGRGLHVYSMAGKTDLKLGRGHESDVRIPDVSISRYHATIRFHPAERRFTLDDNKSKFGTLVHLRKGHTLGNGDKFSVQVGRTVLKLFVDETVEATDGILEIQTLSGSPAQNSSVESTPAAQMPASLLDGNRPHQSDSVQSNVHLPIDQNWGGSGEHQLPAGEGLLLGSGGGDHHWMQHRRALAEGLAIHRRVLSRNHAGNRSADSPTLRGGANIYAVLNAGQSDEQMAHATSGDSLAIQGSGQFPGQTSSRPSSVERFPSNPMEHDCPSVEFEHQPECNRPREDISDEQLAQVRPHLDGGRDLGVDGGSVRNHAATRAPLEPAQAPPAVEQQLPPT